MVQLAATLVGKTRPENGPSSPVWRLKDGRIRGDRMKPDAIEAERKHIKDSHMKEENERREFAKMLRAIRDKLDLYGEDALDEEEMALVNERPDFFYPKNFRRVF